MDCQIPKTHFELCLALGIPHPDYLYSILTVKQLHDWHEFLKDNPIGEVRNELRNGLLCALLHNINSKTSKSVFDFMHFVEKPKQTEAEVKTRLEFYLKGLMKNGSRKVNQSFIRTSDR